MIFHKFIFGFSVLQTPSIVNKVFWKSKNSGLSLILYFFAKNKSFFISVYNEIVFKFLFTIGTQRLYKYFLI